MLNLHFFVLLAVSFSSQANGVSIGPVTDLHILNGSLTPDGYTRLAVLPEGMFPGPTITGNKGDSFAINVINELNDTSMDVVTSIHWHGIDQHTFNEFDGGAFVNQCPIIPNTSFSYTFDVPEQAGTFWYHSHYANQYCDGLRGAFVVRDPADPHADLYDIDDDTTIITLADWYHYLSLQASGLPHPNSTLINGKGRYVGGPAVDISVVDVQPGTRYRFRLVSISCDPNWKFSIDNHLMTIIEVDGINVQPLVVDQIQIFAGQRYSFVLNASQPVDNYWIRALPNLKGSNTDNGMNSAILRYAGANITDPTTKDTSGNLPLVETDLHPLVPSAVPGNPYVGGADHNILLDVSFSAAEFQFFVNNVSFGSPSVPILLQILSGVPVGNLSPAGSIYTLKRDESVELSIPAGVVGGPHPVHLHGHSFYVVRSAGNKTYNYENPVLRDVVTIGASGDNVTIRFQADNPGPWFFHCHIDWHLAGGFAVVFAEDVPDIPYTDIPPPSWFDLCPSYYNFTNGTGL